MSGGRGEVGEGGGGGEIWKYLDEANALSCFVNGNTDKGCLKGSAWDG